MGGEKKCCKTCVGEREGISRVVNVVVGRKGE